MEHLQIPSNKKKAPKHDDDQDQLAKQVLI